VFTFRDQAKRFDERDNRSSSAHLGHQSIGEKKPPNGGSCLAFMRLSDGRQSRDQRITHSRFRIMLWHRSFRLMTAFSLRRLCVNVQQSRQID
jgi:hypothetical protein